jgi:hypothetical protein
MARPAFYKKYLQNRRTPFTLLSGSIYRTVLPTFNLQSLKPILRETSRNISAPLKSNGSAYSSLRIFVHPVCRYFVDILANVNLVTGSSGQMSPPGWIFPAPIRIKIHNKLKNARQNILIIIYYNILIIARHYILIFDQIIDTKPNHGNTR